jgi:hypothetical protein
VKRSKPLVRKQWGPTIPTVVKNGLEEYVSWLKPISARMG